MSRFRYEMTEQKIEEWIKEGRGKGEAKEYLPFLTVFDFPSQGLVARNPGVKTGRTEQVFSQNEIWTIDIASLAKRIFDINEQFPLFPLEETLEIARLKNIKHPTYRNNEEGTEVNVIMTTDFIFHVLNQNGERIRVARTVKAKSDLNNYRTIEKLEIERIYWASRNIDWGIIIADSIPPYFAKNCLELNPFYLPDLLNISLYDLEDIYIFMTAKVLENKIPLRFVAKDCDHHLGLKRGVSMKAVRHFIATQRWLFDFHILFDPSVILVIKSAWTKYS